MSSNTSSAPTAPAKLDTILQRSAHPVTVFTLSWCSYCHAVIRLLKSLGVPFQLIELDSGAYLDADLHRRLRAELQHKTGAQTLPQVFVGETSVGGYTETQAALRSGQLEKLLALRGVRIQKT